MSNSVNYNRIAWFYDGLCSLVFGSDIKKAQIELLPFIPKNANILIIGGGTGWIIDEITKTHSTGLSITYIDVSAKMIQLSKKRNFAFNEIEFIETSIENIELRDGADRLLGGRVDHRHRVCLQRFDPGTVDVEISVIVHGCGL